MRTLVRRENQSQHRIHSGDREQTAGASASTDPRNHLVHLQRTIGNQALQRVLHVDSTSRQTQQGFNEADRLGLETAPIFVRSGASAIDHAMLVVGSSEDRREQEADLISAQVGGRAEAHLQMRSSGSTSGFAQDQQPARLPRKPSFSGASAQTLAPPVVGEALRSPGRPLDPDTRSFMEPRFGHDLGRVRIHTGAKASESSRALNAQAYTVGRDVVFADGSYSPRTGPGIRLLAHELTHVVQQQRDMAPVVQCSPLDALKKYKTTQKVWDSDAKAIDAAIAQSPIIAKYGPKKLKSASGNVETWDRPVFEAQYTTYATALGEKPAEITEDLKTVAGFTERKTGKIHLLNRTADVEVLLHEAIHLSSAAQFQNNFGHYMNEGVTQHFTEAVLSEQKLDPGRAYRDELAMADALISDLGEEQVAVAYFQGKLDAYKRILDAFSHTTDQTAFGTWHDRVNSSNHKDWVDAANQLHAILAQR